MWIGTDPQRERATRAAPCSRLGEESVARGSVRIDIPDLTAGKWRNATPHPVHRDLG